jgi:phosphotransferase system  glucose/maltose/N-acetylglucosamine-specific IIC component
MVLNWKVNTMMGLTAFLLTYLFSFTNNTWQTSVFRAGIGFVIFFVLGYIIRVVLYQMSLKKSSSQVENQNTGEASYLDLELEKLGEAVIEEESSSFQQIPLTALHNGENKEI